MELLKKLSETPGISGREELIRRVIADEMSPLVDEVRVDTLGNLVGFKKGAGKIKVMVAAHMDEIGFMVTSIDDNGYIRFAPVGGFDPRALFAQRVLVQGKEDLPGVMTLATKPAHLLDPEEAKRSLKVSDFYIDIGYPAEKVRELVAIGDPITLLRNLLEVGDLVTGKALDDRIGVYVILRALQKLKSHEVDVYAVATVQEEVGLRGAAVSTFEIAPDVGIAIDVTDAIDTPGGDTYDKVTSLHKGVAIKVMDSDSISSHGLVQHLRQLAEDRNIPYQLEILQAGGTDAGMIQLAKSGASVVTLSIPTRYIHTNLETVDMFDVSAAIDLLAAFLEVAHEGSFKPAL